jgi:hypothetical protein
LGHFSRKKISFFSIAPNTRAEARQSARKLSGESSFELAIMTRVCAKRQKLSAKLSGVDSLG